jgi:hypothetical protein
MHQKNLSLILKIYSSNEWPVVDLKKCEKDPKNYGKVLGEDR